MFEMQCILITLFINNFELTLFPRFNTVRTAYTQQQINVHFDLDLFERANDEFSHN